MKIKIIQKILINDKSLITIILLITIKRITQNLKGTIEISTTMIDKINNKEINKISNKKIKEENSEVK